MPGPEAAIEKKCEKVARARGCVFRKTITPGRVGFPDRTLTIPVSLSGCDHAVVILVELKRPGQSPRPHQEVIHRELRQEGYTVWVVDSATLFERFLDDALSG